MKNDNENNGDTRFLFDQWRKGKTLTPELEEAARALKEAKRREMMERRNRWYWKAWYKITFWIDVHLPAIVKSIATAALTALTVYLTKLAGG